MLDEALASAAERVADRWTLLIVAVLSEAPQRFSDLQEALDGIAPNTLSRRLSQLEADGLVVATPYQDRPERFAYALTDAGRDLEDVLRALRGWAARRGDAAPPRHDLCGTEVGLRWWCDQCGQPVAEPDAELVYL